MGSAKALELVKQTTVDKMGITRFGFLDEFSVLDYVDKKHGYTMPDQIPNKGTSLAMCSAYTMEMAESIGILTHYRGMVNRNGAVVSLAELKEPSNVMEVDLVNVIKPLEIEGGYDYSVYAPDMKNFLIPLEVIYRNSLPEGSSVFRRLERGDITYQDLGLKEYPEPGLVLEKPILDVSTKLESTDRYITWDEAAELAQLSEKDIVNIKKILVKTNELITKIYSNINMVNEDGKIELAFDDKGRIMVVDVFGTPEECRLTYNGRSLSKEIPRKHYRKTPWYKDVEKAKADAKKADEKVWQKFCTSKPKPMPAEIVSLFSDACASPIDELFRTDKRFTRALFDSPSLENIARRIDAVA